MIHNHDCYDHGCWLRWLCVDNSSDEEKNENVDDLVSRRNEFAKSFIPSEPKRQIKYFFMYRLDDNYDHGKFY